jgi:hypothetical protein
MPASIRFMTQSPESVSIDGRVSTKPTPAVPRDYLLTTKSEWNTPKCACQHNPDQFAGAGSGLG